MKKEHHEFKIIPPFVNQRAAIDVRLSAEIEKYIQQLTAQQFDVIKNKLIYREPENLPVYKIPSIKKGEKNLTADFSQKDYGFLKLAVLFSIISETVIFYNIFEKVLGFSPLKSALGALGMTAILFCSAILIKSSVNQYLKNTRNHAKTI